jgi:hypothetical protein
MIAPLPQPRRQVEYRRPRRINGVSVSLVVVLAAAAYTLYSLWPVFTLRAAVKNELADALPQLWRLNLRPSDDAGPELVSLKQAVLSRIRGAGVKDKKLELVVQRGKEKVAIEAHFTATAVFPVWDKRVPVSCSPRVETDAARVEW